MKTPALRRVLALFTFILSLSFVAQAQIKITPANPNERLVDPSEKTKLVFNCITCTYCDINKNNEMNNCVQKEEKTTIIIDASGSKYTVTIIKPQKTEKYYISSSKNEEATNSLELSVYDSEEDDRQGTIIVFGNDNLISVQKDFYFWDYDDTWDHETAMSKIGGTIEIYEMEP